LDKKIFFIPESKTNLVLGVTGPCPTSSGIYKYHYYKLKFERAAMVTPIML